MWFTVSMPKELQAKPKLSDFTEDISVDSSGDGTRQFLAEVLGTDVLRIGYNPMNSKITLSHAQARRLLVLARLGVIVEDAVNTVKERRRSPTRMEQARKQVDEHRKWLESHGGTFLSYVERYGSYSDPDHYGDGGEAIWTADVAAYNKAEAVLADLENRTPRPWAR